MRRVPLLVALAIALSGCSMPANCGPGPATWSDASIYALLPEDSTKAPWGTALPTDPPTWFHGVEYSNDTLTMRSDGYRLAAEADGVSAAAMYAHVTAFLQATTNMTGHAIHEMAMTLIGSGMERTKYGDEPRTMTFYGAEYNEFDPKGLRDHAGVFVAAGGLDMPPAKTVELAGYTWRFAFEHRTLWGPGYSLAADTMHDVTFEMYYAGGEKPRDWTHDELNATMAEVLVGIGAAVPANPAIGLQACH